MNLDLRYHNYDFDEEKSLVKYIKQIERQFRSSTEYRQWVYLQNNTYRLTCPFSKIQNDDIENNNLIELHHHPITLYDIINILVEESLDKEIDLNQISTFRISEHIQRQHLLDMVSYVPLTKTYHQLYHTLEKDIYSDSLEIKDEWVINLDKSEVLVKFLKSFDYGG